VAPSQSKTQRFFRDHPRIVFFGALVVILLLTAVVSTSVRLMIGSQGVASQSSSGEASPEEDTNQIIEPTAVPSDGSEVDDKNDDIRCSASQNAEQYAALVNRILDYEEARLQPGFNTDKEAMRVFATETYVASHFKVRESTSNPNASAVIDRETTIIGCYTVSDSRIIVQARIVMSTFVTDDTGEATLVNQFLEPLPAHNTGWVLTNGVWYVDSEQR